MKFSAFFLIFSAGLLANSLPHSAALTSTPIEGLWLRSCHSGSIQVQDFSGNKSASNEIFFQEADCHSPMLAFLNDGAFKVEGQNIDFQFDTVSMVLYTDSLVSDYNSRAVCGKTDWRKNAVKEITGLKCALFQPSKLIQTPLKGEMRFGIWKRDLSKLYFGQLSREQNGTTPEQRPTNWDPLPYFKQR